MYSSLEKTKRLDELGILSLTERTHYLSPAFDTLGSLIIIPNGNQASIIAAHPLQSRKVGKAR